MPSSSDESSHITLGGLRPIDSYFSKDPPRRQRRRNLQSWMPTPEEHNVPEIEMGPTIADQILGQVKVDFPMARPRTLPKSIGALGAGNRFIGRQAAPDSEKSYTVHVDIKDVDFDQSLVCGYLTINDLTVEYPELTTFFEGEIIGPKYSFLTGKWDADYTADQRHWGKFNYFTDHCQHYLQRPPSQHRTFSTSENAFGQIRRTSWNTLFENVHLHSGTMSGRAPIPADPPLYYDFMKEPVIFMRWKEYFLVPDHHVENVSGASYAGFYYIAYDKRERRLEGYYFHHDSKDYQRLELNYQERKTFPSFEFR